MNLKLLIFLSSFPVFFLPLLVLLSVALLNYIPCEDKLNHTMTPWNTEREICWKPILVTLQRNRFPL